MTHPRSSRTDVARQLAGLIAAVVAAAGSAAVVQPLAALVCPECGRPPQHPDDRVSGYCGTCHRGTGRPVVAGGAGAPPPAGPGVLPGRG